MGLMDKVKAQASQAAAKAQEGLKTGQAKLDEAQAAKRADALLRDLGAQVYAQRVGRGDAATEVEIERLIGELQAHEERTRPIDTAPTAGPAATPAPDAGPDEPAPAPAAEAGSGPAEPTAGAGGASYSLDDL
jgi:hypothetical protein